MFFRSRKKNWEGNVFRHVFVCLSVHRGVSVDVTGPPLYRNPSTCSNLFNLDLIVQGPGQLTPSHPKTWTHSNMFMRLKQSHSKSYRHNSQSDNNFTFILQVSCYRKISRNLFLKFLLKLSANRRSGRICKQFYFLFLQTPTSFRWKQAKKLSLWLPEKSVKFSLIKKSVKQSWFHC